MTAVKATAEDRPALVATLAAAFHDDPVAEWVFPDDDIRLRTLPRVYAVDVAQMHRDDCVWTTSDRDAAALWAPPGRWRHGVRDDLAMLRASWHWRLLPRLIGMARAFYELERLHPERPHYYLSDLGVAPSSQGMGRGAAVIAPVLATCDAEGVGAYLESSKLENVPFYERQGFKLTGEFAIPGGGPVLYLMWRDPR